MNRRYFLFSIAGVTAVIRTVRADGAAEDPWSQSELVEPAILAKEVTSGAQQLHVICVTFRFLYQQKHVPHAQFAGPAEKPEGMAELHSAVRSLPKNASIVIYCGCCPMDKCPNIRPAYRALKELGFKHIRVLNLPTNFHTDWTAKGYPVEA
jgi:hypothetical protein